MIKKTTNKIRIFILPLFAVLFALLFFGRNYFQEAGFFKKISEVNLTLASPVFRLRNLLVGSVADAGGFFKSNKKTNALINELREENLKLKSENFKTKLLQKENDEILSVLGRNPDKKFIIASVLYYPPHSDFDILLIDAGKREGVSYGMKVLAADGVTTLGEIAEAYERESKVKLYSHFGNKTVVLFENSGLLANAAGRGGENFEVALPKEFAASANEKIFLSGGERFLLGEVNKIIEDKNAPVKKVYFRIPFNLNELSYVFILR